MAVMIINKSLSMFTDPFGQQDVLVSAMDDQMVRAGTTADGGSYTLVAEGTGFTYDEFGDLVAGTATSLNLYGALDFSIQGVSFDLSQNYYDTGYTADGQVLYGWAAEMAYMMRSNDSITGANGSDTLAGFEGHDTLRGGGGNDSIDGWSGNDSIEGGLGNDVLRGGSGNDVILGQEGRDSLYGSAGNDTMDGGVVTDRINYTDLNFTSYSGATVAVNINLSGITGTGSTGSGSVTIGSEVDSLANINFMLASNWGDTILGSSALIFEQFEGAGGNDTINGGAITDLVNLDNSNRVTYESAGAAVTADLAAGTVLTSNTTVTGSSGNDTLVNINQVRGSAHNDTLRGSDNALYTEAFEGLGGNDLIDGRGGYDMVRFDRAGAGVVVNLVTGTATGTATGNDTLAGIEGIQGTAYNDTLVGGNTANGSAYSGDGASRIEFFRGGAGTNSIDGGVGLDRVDYVQSYTGVTVTLTHNTTTQVVTGVGTGGRYSQDAYFLSGKDTFVNIEGVRGSDFNDTLTGSDRATTDGYFEFFEGRQGNDVIDGRGGYDRADYGGARAAVQVNLATGTAADGYGSTDTLRNIEGARGSTFGDTLTGSEAANKLEGMDGNDTVLAAGGNDTLDGGNGHDSLDGGAGNDSLDGGTGNDTLLGGAGNDSYKVDSSTDRVSEATTLGGTTDAGGSADQVLSTATYSLDTDAGTRFVEHLRLDGTAHINGTGNALANTIYANTGNNVLNGLGGTDWASYFYATGGVSVTLASTAAQATGASGTDTLLNFENLAGSNYGDNLRGSTGNNVIDGKSGDDKLTGNLGNDTLTGGVGKDIFRFDSALNATTNVDRISDFSVVDDTVQLENSIFTKLATTGTLAAANFVANTAGVAMDANDYIVYDTDSGQLYYDADGNGAGAAVLFATLTTGLALTAADFVVT